MKDFELINKGYNSVFKPNQLSIGIVVPIENYASNPIPTMKHHLERVQLIDRLGFKALWLRDVPFNVPTFGDAGQTFDPFTYLGYLAGRTKDIALGVASIALPLHYPVHVAKSAATVDQLSEGRLILEHRFSNIKNPIWERLGGQGRQGGQGRKLLLTPLSSPSPHSSLSYPTKNFWLLNRRSRGGIRRSIRRVSCNGNRL